MFAVLVVAFVAILPIILEAVELVLAMPNVDQLTKMIVSLLPLFTAMSVLFVLFVYVGR